MAINKQFKKIGKPGQLAVAEDAQTVSTTDARTFCALLGKILTTQVAGDADAGPVRIEYALLPPQSSGR